MCGIIGMLAFDEMPDKKMEKTRQEAMIYLSSELLQLTQPRGKDATGISTMFSNLDYMGLKMGVPSTDFISRFGGTERDFDGYLSIWRKKTSPARMVLGHCRKSSVGNSEDNVNNHPIKVGDIVGVHNGTLTNHEKIFELLKSKRDGTVDSEAIFRLLHYFTKNGEEPFSPKIIQEVCRRLHGSYSCLSFSGNNPYQMIGFRDARPMEALLIKPLKLMVIASDKDFLKHVVFRHNIMTHLYQTGTVKFPVLKKNDVELKSLADDTLYIFDIRKGVTDNTKIEDLYISEKIPRVDKIWDTKTVSNTYNTGFKRETYNNKKTGDTTSEGYTHNKTTTEDKENKRLGMAWNKSSHSYQKVEEIEAAKKHTNVEIDSKNGEVVDAKTKKVLVVGEKKAEVNKNTKFELKSIDKDIDTLIISHALVTELDVPTENTSTDNEKTGEETEVVDVVLETYPEALEKAGVALREENNFSNINDVRLALDIEAEEDLRKLPLYSLANRIKRFFYKKGWFDGYVSRLKEKDAEQEPSEMESCARKMLLRANDKRKIAEKNIRGMKSIIQIFDKLSGVYQVDDVSIDKAVDSTLKGSDELSVELIKSVFKPGDFKNSPTLGKITTSIELSKQKP